MTYCNISGFLRFNMKNYIILTSKGILARINLLNDSLVLYSCFKKSYLMFLLTFFDTTFFIFEIHIESFVGDYLKSGYFLTFTTVYF